MISKVIETEHGLALLLPTTLGLCPGVVNVSGDANYGVVIHSPKRISKDEWAKLLVGSEENDGIELPEDSPPAPIRFPSL